MIGLNIETDLKVKTITIISIYYELQHIFMLSVTIHILCTSKCLCFIRISFLFMKVCD